MFAFVDFQKWGITEILGAGETSHPVKGYQQSSDGIYIFLNFDQIAVVKSKAEAVSIIKRLVLQAPDEARKELEEYGEYLLRSLE